MITDLLHFWAKFEAQQGLVLIWKCPSQHLKTSLHKNSILVYWSWLACLALMLLALSGALNVIQIWAIFLFSPSRMPQEPSLKVANDISSIQLRETHTAYAKWTTNKQRHSYHMTECAHVPRRPCSRLFVCQFSIVYLFVSFLLLTNTCCLLPASSLVCLLLLLFVWLSWINLRRSNKSVTWKKIFQIHGKSYVSPPPMSSFLIKSIFQPQNTLREKKWM